MRHSRSFSCKIQLTHVINVTFWKLWIYKSITMTTAWCICCNSISYVWKKKCSSFCSYWFRNVLSLGRGLVANGSATLSFSYNATSNKLSSCKLKCNLCPISWTNNGNIYVILPNVSWLTIDTVNWFYHHTGNLG